MQRTAAVFAQIEKSGTGKTRVHTCLPAYVHLKNTHTHTRFDSYTKNWLTCSCTSYMRTHLPYIICLYSLISSLLCEFMTHGKYLAGNTQTHMFVNTDTHCSFSLYNVCKSTVECSYFPFCLAPLHIYCVCGGTEKTHTQRKINGVCVSCGFK